MKGMENLSICCRVFSNHERNDSSSICLLSQRSILLDCETQIERLLATVFENYKSLDENSPTGLTDHFGPASDSAAPALHPALQVYSSLHDILSTDAQTILQNYLQVTLCSHYTDN